MPPKTQRAKTQRAKMQRVEKGITVTDAITIYKPSASLVPQLENAAMQAMQDDLESIAIKFPKVKIPTGGGAAYTLPGDEFAKEIVGVIIDHHAANAYWPGRFAGSGTPPQCTSIDGKVGVGDPGGSCRRCPFNQFGSGVDAEGNATRGKACKNMRRVYVMVPGQAMPWLLILSPGSLKNFEEYIQNVIIPRGLGVRQVVTTIGLRKEKNAGGIEYAQATFKCSAVLSADDAATVAQYAAQMRDQTRGGAVEADDLDD